MVPYARDAARLMGANVCAALGITPFTPAP